MSKPILMTAAEWLWMFHKTYRKAREFCAGHVASSHLVKSGQFTKDHACYDNAIGVWNERNLLLEIVQTVMEVATPLANDLFASNSEDRYTLEHRTSQRITAVYNILVEVRDKLINMFPMDQAPGEIIKEK